MPRFFIKLKYVGTRYHGWQIQENTPLTVQQELNKAISKILNEKIETLGCGRTDTGVHATEYFAHFDTTKKMEEDIDWIYKFNSVLPNDIVVSDLFLVDGDVNARFHATARTYEYHLIKERNPFYNERACFLYAPLDIKKMNEAAQILFKYSDFECFSKTNTQVKTTICKIMRAEWEQKGDVLVFTIKADRFLRNMVRAIVGTLVDIGKGKTSIDDLKEIIEGGKRSDAGESMPACGLYLTRVEYPAEILKTKYGKASTAHH